MLKKPIRSPAKLSKSYISRARELANAKRAPQNTHWATVAGILSAWLAEKDAQLRIQGKK